MEKQLQSSEELSEEETFATFNDQRLYKGEKTQQGNKDMERFSDKSKAQKDWNRKCFQIDRNETYKSAMMYWENLDDSEQARKKRKTIGQDEETNDGMEMQADEMDDKKHIKRTIYTGNRLNIPVEELKLGADDDASTLATQETSAKNLVYITNIQEGKLGTTNNARDTSKNPSEQDDKKISPLKKSDSVNRNDNLKSYGESGRDDNPRRDKEQKKKTKNMRNIIHMEFDMEDDVEEQLKNANDVKAEGKELRKPKMITKLQVKMMKKIRLLSPMK